MEERNSILENSKEDYEMKIAEQVNSIEELTIQLGEMKELGEIDIVRAKCRDECWTFQRLLIYNV